MCVVSFQFSFVFILFFIQLLRQGSLIHCDIQDANRKARKLMLKLISADAIPKSLFITDVKTDFDPIAVGGFGRVFRGKYNGQKVALKLLDKGHRKKVGSSTFLSSPKSYLVWTGFALPRLLSGGASMAIALTPFCSPSTGNI